MLAKKSYQIIGLTIIIIVIFSLTISSIVNEHFFSHKYLAAQATFSFVNNIDIEWMETTSAKVVALTFDDGPDPRFTPKILEILKTYHVPAAFFVEGANVVKYPQLLTAEIRSGHEIGNHTFSHPHLRSLNLAQIKKEIQAADGVIEKVTGKTPVIFRSPYEEVTINIIAAARYGHKRIIMSTLTLEHESAYTPKAKAERLVKLVFPGAIILAHDGRLDRTSSIEALPYLITELKAKGYRFVSLKELLKINF